MDQTTLKNGRGTVDTLDMDTYGQSHPERGGGVSTLGIQVIILSTGDYASAIPA